MNIAYAYEIVDVNPEARALGIIYTTEGHPPIYIGAAWPEINEPIEAVVHRMAPLHTWLTAWQQAHPGEPLPDGPPLPPWPTTGTLVGTI